MNKTGLDDPSLSFKAKGILAFLLSKPDHWEVYVSYLAKQATDGLTAVRSGIKELVDHGYMTFERHHDSNGKFSEGCYTVFERPRSGFPHVVKPNEDNRTLVSNDLLVSNDNSKGARDFLADVVQQAQSKAVDDKPRGWTASTDDEFEVCKRVAQHWRNGILPKLAKHIESSLAGANELLSMHNDDRRATLLTLDQYHLEYEKEDLDLQISGPQSLVNLIPSFLGRRQKTTTRNVKQSMDNDPQVQAFRKLRLQQERDNDGNQSEGTERVVGDIEPQGSGNDTGRPQRTFPGIRRSGA